MHFTCPAQYQPYVRAAIAIALADVERDQRHRALNDEVVNRYLPVDEALFDASAEGRLAIVFVAAPDAVPPDRAEHLVAFSLLTR